MHSTMACSSESKRQKMRNNDTISCLRPRAETRVITTVDGMEVFNVRVDPVAIECRDIARLLGGGPLDISCFLDEAWVTTLHGLALRGISSDALVRYFQIIATGMVTDPVDDVINEVSKVSQREVRVHELPEILRSAEAGQEFTAEFVEFANGFTEADYSNRTKLDNACCTLMANRGRFFKDEFCKVIVVIRASDRILSTVRNAYARVAPHLRTLKGDVSSEKFDNVSKEWIVQGHNGVGRARTKKEARMIAIIRDQLDPGFTGEAPARVPLASRPAI